MGKTGEPGGNPCDTLYEVQTEFMSNTAHCANMLPSANLSFLKIQKAYCNYKMHVVFLAKR